jgi:hypothetical protein
MARDRTVDMSPRFLSAILEDQLVPGTLADAVNLLVDLPRPFSVRRSLAQ